MSKLHVLPLAGAALFLAWALVHDRPAPPFDWSEAELVDVLGFDYVEDEPGGRVLAAVDARLERAGDVGRLVVVASASGPNVDPPPGWTERRGTNRITARELGRLLDGESRLVVRTRDRDERTRAATFAAGRLEALPSRRLLPSGAIEWTGAGAPLPVELTIESAPLELGEHVLEVLVDDAVRLWVRFELDESGGRIVDHATPGPADPQGGRS